MFLKEKPASLLIFLLEEDMYLSKLARKSNVTYVYINKMMPLLISKGLVVKVQKGKYQVASLTEKGKELAKMLKEIKQKEA